MESLWLESPHRRWNPLKGEWVVVSPHRTQRPWQGQTEDASVPVIPEYDPKCYLCPGNTRANGEVTPKYESTFVFPNDFAALKPDVQEATLDVEQAGLLRATTERGICRVLCFHPRHDLTLATMTPAQIAPVVEMWSEQVAELGARPEIQYVQVFENRGSMMGASNPHPHGQLWATEHIPNEPLAELKAQRAYFEAQGKPLLNDYLTLELKQKERVVVENDGWVVVVPFWAVWPFETLLLPRRAVGSFSDLTVAEKEQLAEILHLLTAGYNRVFDTPFPYSMGFHIAPVDGEEHPEWVMHAHFYPPLLRSATVRKFMVGFELLGSPQRDITPESAAETLRRVIAR
ncbi:MAG: UDP-glucose--hexose-1-phosphate uridylyltransferase [Acidobacteriaceae bacterium]|nr:UDP-glucose--hexose-1-phosphate uridylyltransferase [Acidobacteriaceae bacterium]